MKKQMLAGVCLGMSVMMTACGANDEWIAKGTEMVSSELSSSEIYIDGTVYTFPCDMSYWINTGWHVSNSYDNKDDFELEPGMESTEFELFNDNKQYVKVTVLNMSDENATVEKCMVSSLEIAVEDFEAVLPSGVTTKSTSEDIKTAYGEPTSTEGTAMYYEYTNADEWICQVEMDVDGDKKKPLTTVKYTLTDDNWGGSEEDVRTYMDTALRTSFYGDYTEYVANMYDTEENAIELYESEVAYYAESLMYYLDMDSSVLDEVTIESYYKIAEMVLSKAKWEITNMQYDENTLTGTMELTLYPVDFLYIIDSDADMVIAEFQNKYSNVDPDSCTDEELAAIEQDYANMMLEVLNARAAETKVSDPVVKTYNIDYMTGVVTEDDWYEIDDILMGFEE